MPAASSSTTLPEPLVPEHVYFGDADTMPLKGHRLFTSETWMHNKPEQNVVALRLWWEAWRQRPAASLPGSDESIRKLAGVSTHKWPWIREGAMRGFVLCSDGRYYHRILAELALDRSTWWVSRDLARTFERKRKQVERRKKASNPDLFSEKPPEVAEPETEEIRQSDPKSVRGQDPDMRVTTPEVVRPMSRDVNRLDIEDTNVSSPDPAFPGTPIPLRMVRIDDRDPDAWGKALFTHGLAYLERQGIANRTGRGLIGLWLKRAGGDHRAILEVLATAEQSNVRDVRSYVTATVTPREGGATANGPKHPAGNGTGKGTGRAATGSTPYLARVMEHRGDQGSD